MVKSLHKLFSYIGRALSPMVVGLVSGLESLYLHSDARVRDVAISITTRLIVENSDVFLEVDNLGAVWNIYFLLDYTSISKHKRAPYSGTRLAICQALKVLSSLYTPAQQSLTFQIVLKLLKLSNKSEQEIKAVKETLSQIFDNVMHMESEARYSLYPTFMQLITAHFEHFYDLIEWVVTRYSQLLHAMLVKSNKRYDV